MFPSISYWKWNIECMCMPKYDNNEVCHILVLSVTSRKKSSTQICITYLNLEKIHIYSVVCFMLFVDDDECLKTPPVCDINANCKNTLGSYLCSCKEGFKGDGKTCQGKIKKETWKHTENTKCYLLEQKLLYYEVRSSSI